MSTGILKQLLDNPANRLTFVAGVVCLFLFVLWLVEIVASPESIVLPPPTAANRDTLPDTRVAAVLDTPSLAEYEAVIERPLFNEDRLPSEDEDADAEDEEAAGSAQIPPMQLAGVVLTGEHQIAMLMREGGRPLRMEVGMDVEGWVLEGLEPRRAILSNGVNSVELELPLYMAPAIRKSSAQRGTENQPPRPARAKRQEPFFPGTHKSVIRPVRSGHECPGTDTAGSRGARTHAPGRPAELGQVQRSGRTKTGNGPGTRRQLGQATGRLIRNNNDKADHRRSAS